MKEECDTAGSRLSPQCLVLCPLPLFLSRCHSQGTIVDPTRPASVLENREVLL